MSPLGFPDPVCVLDGAEVPCWEGATLGDVAASYLWTVLDLGYQTVSVVITGLALLLLTAGIVAAVKVMGERS